MKTVIVGGGQGCRDVLEWRVQKQLTALDRDVVGVVDPNPDAPGMVYAAEHGVSTHTDMYRALRDPELQLVLELTGDDAVSDAVARVIPNHVRLMDHHMARVFWDLDEKAKGLNAQLQRKTELEREIRGDRQRLQEIIDSLPSVVMVLDQNGVI